MKTDQQIWDQRYSCPNPERHVQYDPWLKRWEKYFVYKSGNALDLGCGLGFDTEVLLSYGFQVMALDYSREALRYSQNRNPNATHILCDLTEGINIENKQFPVIVANLSLHYFSKATIIKVFQEIDDLLEDHGFFAFRVNCSISNYFLVKISHYLLVNNLP